MTRDYRERHSLASQWDYVNIHNNVPHNTAANQNCSLFFFFCFLFFFPFSSFLSPLKTISYSTTLIYSSCENRIYGQAKVKQNQTALSSLRVIRAMFPKKCCISENIKKTYCHIIYYNLYLYFQKATNQNKVDSKRAALQVSAHTQKENWMISQGYFTMLINRRYTQSYQFHKNLLVSLCVCVWISIT